MAGSEKIGVSAGNCEAQGKQERLKSVIIAGTLQISGNLGNRGKKPKKSKKTKSRVKAGP